MAPISATWRGHVDCVTLTAPVDNREILLTSSLDATCRAWTFDGEYVGTFGQKEKWDLMEETSWGHPYTPDDVLMETTFPTLKVAVHYNCTFKNCLNRKWKVAMLHLQLVVRSLGEIG